MILFLDTEFSSLPSGELISIALVPLTSPGYYFYAENADNNPNMRSAWVQQNVIPHLHNEEILSMHKIRALINQYLKSLALDGKYTIVADYVHDFALFRESVLDYDLPKQYKYKCAFRQNEFWDEANRLGYASIDLKNRALEKYPEYMLEWFEKNPTKPQHNALNDANSQRYAWVKCFEWLNSQTQ